MRPSFVGDPDAYKTHKSILFNLWGSDKTKEEKDDDDLKKVTKTLVYGVADEDKKLIKIKPRNDLIPVDEEEMTLFQLICMICIYTSLLIYTFIILFGDLILLPSNETDWCHAAKMGYITTKYYSNIDFNNNPCFRERTVWLLGMNQQECDFGKRMIVSVFLGAVIGLERKASDRPAGIRTMGLVCLGSCFFSMCGQIAFRSSTMGWDAARVSAAVPSGVGFLGAGLIWKGSVGEKGTPNERPEVHGLTTAASVWLSAAVGVGVGGRLFIVSFYAVVLVVMVLRLGPRMYFTADGSYGEDSDEEEEEEEEWDSGNEISSASDNDAFGEDDENGYSREEQMRLLMGNKKDEELEQIEKEYETSEEAMKAHMMDRKELFRSAPDLFVLKSLPSSGGEEDEIEGDDTEEEFVPIVDHSSDAYRRTNSRESVGLRRRSTRRSSRRHRSHSPAKRTRHARPSFIS